MINKLFLFILLFSTLLLLLVFNVPNTALFIEKNLNITWFTTSVENFKKYYYEVILNIPLKEEVTDRYHKVLNESISWATYYKDKIVEKGEFTKWKIDSIRKSISWVVDDYNKTVNVINTTSDTINDWIKMASWKINDTIEKINSASWKIDDTIEKIKTVIGTWQTVIGTWQTVIGTWQTN